MMPLVGIFQRRSIASAIIYEFSPQYAIDQRAPGRYKAFEGIAPEASRQTDFNEAPPASDAARKDDTGIKDEIYSIDR